MKNTIKHLVSLFLIYALNTAVYAEITVNSKSSLDHYERNGTLDCSAYSSWVEQPFLPEDPKDTGNSNTNCTFNQFAWQSFAYLTENGTSQKPRFLEMMPKERVFKRIPDTWDLHGDTCLVLSDIFQAGSKDPLNDQNINPILYQQSINEIFYDDIVSHRLNNKQCIDEIDSSSQLRKLDFILPKAIEIKTSWKVLTPNDDASKFFTIYRKVSYGKFFKNTQLALLGMHIVIKTPRHPEWIWTSFEHKDNVPDCDNIPSNNSRDNWILYNPNGTDQLTNVYSVGQPTQVCRKTPYGVGVPVLEQKAQDGLIKNIEELNVGMTDIYQERGSVWSNYFLVGSSWTKGGDIPPTPDNEIRGSRLLSNSSMETYTQNPKDFEQKHPEEHRGCFACHNYNPDKENALHLSHMFDGVDNYGNYGNYCTPPLSNFQKK